MKRMAAILLAMVLLCAHALAFSGAEYPAWDGAELPDNSIGLSFGGEKLLLEFDPSADYSKVENGEIQACFFAYNKAETHYLEMYIVLPQDIAAGDVISGKNTGAGAKFGAVSLYEVSKTGEDSWFASTDEKGAYPEKSSLEIVIEKAIITGESIMVSGSLSAGMCRYMGSLPTDEMLQLSDARFQFALPLKGNAVPQLPGASAEPAPSAPAVKQFPAFTLPPDYVEL